MGNDNQKGFGTVEALLIVVVVGIVGFTGWYVWHAKQNTDKSLTSTASTPVFKKSKDKTTTTPSSTQPATSSSTSATSTSTKSTTISTKPKSPSPAPTPQKRTINFTKGGQQQQGSAVIIDAYLSESQTGTCTYVFSQNGSTELTEHSAIDGSNDCHILISSSDFPQSGTYSFTIHFASENGLVSANQGANTVDVSK